MTLVLAIAVPLVGSLGVVALARAARRAAASVASAASVLTLGTAVALAQALSAGKDVLVADIGPWLPLRGAHLALRLEPPLVPILLATAVAVSIVLGASLRRPAAPGTYAAVLVLLAATNTLLLGTDLVLLFVAWEVAAIAGYVLLSGGRPAASAADTANASLAGARLVDAALLVAVVAILAVFRSVDLGEVGSRAALQTLAPSATLALRWCGVLFGLVALARGAQLPFARWLGDASGMDAPSSAAVRALLAPGGAILLVRVAPILPAESLTAAAVIGGATAVFAVTVAVAQREGARGVAWLAVAQIGTVFAALAWSVEVALTLLVVNVAVQTALALAADLAPARVGWRALLRTDAGRGAWGLPRAGAAARSAVAYPAGPLAQGTERILRGAVAAVGGGTAVAAALAAGAHAAVARRSLLVLVAGALALVAFWGAR